MIVEYDEESDAAYVWLVNDIAKEGERYTGEIWPEELHDKVGLLFDSDNRLLGLEVMSASTLLPSALLQGASRYDR